MTQIELYAKGLRQFLRPPPVTASPNILTLQGFVIKSCVWTEVISTRYMLPYGIQFRTTILSRSGAASPSLYHLSSLQRFK